MNGKLLCAFSLIAVIAGIFTFSFNKMKINYISVALKVAKEQI